MDKEDLKDIFRELELEYNVDIIVSGKYRFKVQVIGHKQKNDIISLYDSVLNASNRFTSIHDFDSQINIAWCEEGHTHPKLYQIKKISDIDNSEKEFVDILLHKYINAADNGYDYEINPQFFGFIIYFNSNINDSYKIKRIGELIRESHDWEKLADIVKDIQDDIEIDHGLEYSKISKVNGYLKLVMITHDTDNRIDFNNHLISRLGWSLDKGEIEIEEIQILLSETKSNRTHRYLMDYPNQQNLPNVLSTGSKLKLTNNDNKILDKIKSDYLSHIIGWWIYFYPPNDIKKN